MSNCTMSRHTCSIIFSSGLVARHFIMVMVGSVEEGDVSAVLLALLVGLGFMIAKHMLVGHGRSGSGI